jgi:uncharacterized protein (DUF1778 family)
MYPTENLTARVYSLHADIVRRAAAKAGKTISEYVGDVVVPWAASDLGEAMPRLPKLERGRYKAMVEQAAKRAGMTPAQWERHAAETLSAQALGLPTPDDARAPGKPPTVPPPAPQRNTDSGVRAMVRVGGYAKQYVEDHKIEVVRRPQRRQA